MFVPRNVITPFVRSVYRIHTSCVPKIYESMNKSKVKDQKLTETTRQEKIRRARESANKLIPPVTMRIHVLGSGKNCTTRSMLVDFTTQKYLFNCTEGTQRVLGDRKLADHLMDDASPCHIDLFTLKPLLRLSRVENVFITKSLWKNVSGLSGLYLTIDGTPVSSLKLCGQESVTSFMRLAGSMTEGRTTKLEFTGLDDGFLDDNAMKTELIKLISSSTDNSPGTETETEPGSKRARMDDEKDTAIAYLCQPHPSPRKVSVQKILQMNIPRDKTIGKLVDGETVILSDGREDYIYTSEQIFGQTEHRQKPLYFGTDLHKIKPDDILEPQVETLPLLVVECFDSSYLPSLNSSTTLQQFYADGLRNSLEAGQKKDAQSIDHSADLEQEQSGKQLGMVIHFTSVDVIQQQAYQNWMKRFPPATKHLVINEWGSDVSLHRPYKLQACLNQIHPTIFPLMETHTHQGDFLDPAPIDVDNVTIGHPGLIYTMRGCASDIDTYTSEACYQINNEEIIAEVSTEESRKEIEILQEKLNSLTKADMIDTRTYPEVVFLGTGSAVPCPTRNVSAILLHLSNDGCMLLDAGEDTAGQIRRFYGDKADEVFCKLKAIFISHKHADHHMGVTSVILERERCLLAKGLPTDPILMVIPQRYIHFLETLDNIFNFELIKKIVCVNNETLLDGASMVSVGMKNLKLPISSIRTCRVRHRQDPFGLILTLENGFKLVYSGDTKPCNELVRKGKDCDLLIHEATMADDLKEDAAKKDHSTTSEAIKIGQQMNAKFTILTHFSQRYSKLPLLNENFHDRVATAFDNMKVCPREFHMLPLLFPAVKALWWEAYEQLESKQFIRSLKREREKELEKQKVKAQESESETKASESRNVTGATSQGSSEGHSESSKDTNTGSNSEGETVMDSQCKNVR